MEERVIRTLKEQCAHRHRFETQQHALRVISDWIQFQPPAPASGLGMKTPAEAYAFCAETAGSLHHRIKDHNGSIPAFVVRRLRNTRYFYFWITGSDLDLASSMCRAAAKYEFSFAQRLEISVYARRRGLSWSSEMISLA